MHSSSNEVLVGTDVDDKTVVFVDGPALYSTARALGIQVDFERLRAVFVKTSRLVRIKYYTTELVEDDGTVATRKLTDWLSYNGYDVVSRPAKTSVDDEGIRRRRGNMNVEIAVDMVDAASKVDNVVLFSGDGDLRYALAAVKRLGAKTTVVSSVEASQVSDDLRKAADTFVDLRDLAPFVEKILSHNKWENDA